MTYAHRLRKSSILERLQVKDFVNRYMPAYKAYLPHMYKEGPTTGKDDNVLMFEIDESRGLVHAKNPTAENHGKQ